MQRGCRDRRRFEVSALNCKGRQIGWVAVVCWSAELKKQPGGILIICWLPAELREAHS